jgi:hypothetical protein
MVQKQKERNIYTTVNNLFHVILILAVADSAGIAFKYYLRKRVACIDGFNGIRKYSDDAEAENVIGAFGDD